MLLKLICTEWISWSWEQFSAKNCRLVYFIYRLCSWLN